MKKSLRILPVFFAGIFFITGIKAQIVTLKPANPGINDSITVYYHADQGNKTLMGYAGDLYLHTGIISSKSIDGHDWKYVVGNWGTDDKTVKMKREGKDLYSLRMVIKSFYKLRAEDKANQLAFVFRNMEGTIVGKTKENEDILAAVDGYVPVKQNTESLNRQSHSMIAIEQDNAGATWRILTEEGAIFIKPYAANIVGVWFTKGKNDKPDSSHAVVLKPEKVQIQTERRSSATSLRAGDMSIIVHHSPLYLTYIYNGDTLLKEESGFFQRPGNTGVRFVYPADEKIYGAGERSTSMDRRGMKFPLYNRPFYAYEEGATMLNYSIPLLFSSKKYLVLFDNPQKGYVDIGKTEPDVIEWNAIGGPAKYFIVAGKSFGEVTESYTKLTGRQEMPPRWVMGNLQSRMAYRNQKEVSGIVKQMQKQDFPIDAVILDFYWFGDSILGHLGRLDWYKKAWPKPEKMIRNFKKKGVKTILITEPYLIDSVPNFKIASEKGLLATDSLGNTYVNQQFYFGPGGLIDIFQPEAREWFWQFYQKQIKKGVAAWWGDLGEPESHPSDLYHVNGKADEVHNIYGHYWDRMIYDKYVANYPNTRLFHLQRSGFAGSQRYSAYPWTGDVSRSWSGYRAQMPLLLTMGMSGLAYIHSDAGGFAQGVKDDELYTRWLQFAAFTPVLRPHGSGIPSEPIFWSEKTQEIVKKYIKLRYTLLPYNYTMAWQNFSKGTPLMRPLFYYNPDDKQAIACVDEYYWGDNMLVAPVFEKGVTERKVYLPEGLWYDFHCSKQYQGGQVYSIPVTIEDIPVFAKSGSVIPTTKVVNSTDQYKSDNFRVKIFPSPAFTFTQYEDDGISRLPAIEGKGS